MVNKKMILLKLHEKNKEYKDIINELRSRNSRYEKNTTNMSGNLSHELRNLSN